MTQELDDAERITLQYLLSGLNPHRRTVWTYEDACITAHQIGNRFGVPADATSWQYQITYPDGDWSVQLRAVWRQGKLFRPLQTHVTVLGFYDDHEDLHRGAVGVHALFSEWLSGVPLNVL